MDSLFLADYLQRAIDRARYCVYYSDYNPLNEAQLMQPQDIPGLVKRLRERMGLTQEQFAREVGVTFSTVNQWENGHRRPQPYLLNRLLEMDASLEADRSAGKRRSKKSRHAR